jgi:putative DNA methylase
MRRRRLPHIAVIGQPVFVTFCLCDSLPVNRWFPSANLTSGEAFVAMDRLLDQARSGNRFLARPEVAQLVEESIQRGAAARRYNLHAWVIMPNHVHLLLTPLMASTTAAGWMKGASSRQANLLLQRTGRAFWQDESYDHVVRNGDEFRRIQRYIENNPVKAGLCTNPEEFIWSSARRREAPPQA